MIGVNWKPVKLCLLEQYGRRTISLLLHTHTWQVIELSWVSDWTIGFFPTMGGCPFYRLFILLSMLLVNLSNSFLSLLMNLSWTVQYVFSRKKTKEIVGIVFIIVLIISFYWLICFIHASVDGKQIAMTEDHRVTSQSERTRLIRAGKPLKDGEGRLCGIVLVSYHDTCIANIFL